MMPFKLAAKETLKMRITFVFHAVVRDFLVLLIYIFLRCSQLPLMTPHMKPSQHFLVFSFGSLSLSLLLFPHFNPNFFPRLSRFFLVIVRSVE